MLAVLMLLSGLMGVVSGALMQLAPAEATADLPPGFEEMSAMLQYTIPLSCEVVPEYSFYPPEVRVLPLAGGKTGSVSVRALFKQRKGKPFSIVSVESPSPAIRVSVKRQSPASYFLYFELTSSIDRRASEAIISIVIDSDGLEKTFQYPVRYVESS